MDTTILPTRRRGFVQGALALLGGAFGWKATAETASDRRVAAKSDGRIRFYARNRVLQSGAPGDAPSSGDRRNRRGTLVAKPNGEVVGEYFATNLSQPGMLGAASGSAAGVELQTFRLPDGTLFGAGANERLDDGSTLHAILGGTGAYAGARGTCQISPCASPEFGPNWLTVDIRLLS